MPGDIPVKLLEQFLPELTAPVAALRQEALKTQSRPNSYKKEYHLPHPESEADMRNLGLTPYFSKRHEWLLIKWILPFISSHIEVDQLGGLPDCSVNTNTT